MNSYVGMTKNISKLEFQRTHTLCALSMHFQQSCMCSNNCTAVAGVLHCTRLYIASLSNHSWRPSLKFHLLYACIYM